MIDRQSTTSMHCDEEQTDRWARMCACVFVCVFVVCMCVCVDVFVSMGLCPLCRDRMAGEMVS